MDKPIDLPPGTTIALGGDSAIVFTDPSGKEMVFYGQADGLPSTFVYQGVQNGFVVIVLAGGNFSSYRMVSAAADKPKPPVAVKPKQPVRRLWGKGQGKFLTKGRFASATIRGTWWLIEDYKNGTLVRVKRGIVAVRDYAGKKTKLVKAGQSYFVPKPAKK